MELPSRGGHKASIKEQNQLLSGARKIYDEHSTNYGHVSAAAYDLRVLRESIMDLSESTDREDLAFACEVHELSVLMSLMLREEAAGEFIKALNRLCGAIYPAWKRGKEGNGRDQGGETNSYLTEDDPLISKRRTPSIPSQPSAIPPVLALQPDAPPLPESRLDFLAALCVYFILAGNSDEALLALNRYSRTVESPVPLPTLRLILDTQTAILSANSFLFSRLARTAPSLTKQVLLVYGLPKLRLASLVSLSAAYRPSIPLSFAGPSLLLLGNPDLDPVKPPPRPNEKHCSKNTPLYDALKELLESASKKGVAACGVALKELEDARLKAASETAEPGSENGHETTPVSDEALMRLSLLFKK